MRPTPRLLLAATLISSPLLAEETREVTAGPQYEAGGWHRFLFGGGYRDLWTTPIQTPVLDLQNDKGGLTPVRKVGQAQTLGLAFKGGDGRAYTFRSLHKHPERMLPEIWRDRYPAHVTQDATSGTHPAAAVILPVLAEAAGVADTHPRLAIMPDETSEVRIYLHGGDDRVERTGPAKGPIRVRVIAGSGSNVVDDSASGGTDVWRNRSALEDLVAGDPQ